VNEEALAHWGAVAPKTRTTIAKLSASRHPEFTDQYQKFGMESAVGKADTKFYVVTERVIWKIFFPRMFLPGCRELAEKTSDDFSAVD
jgi:hypothetical protein